MNIYVYMYLAADFCRFPQSHMPNVKAFWKYLLAKIYQKYPAK